MQKKVIAAMVALMMVATGIVILEMTQESDASATDGLATYNFFFAKQGDTTLCVRIQRADLLRIDC